MDTFFSSCQTSEECKSLYRSLFAENCKNAEVMNIINQELKNTLAALMQFDSVKSEVTPAPATTTEETNKRQQLTDAANFAKGLDSKLTIEVANLWVWVAGVKREDKDLQSKLHEYGFKYAHKKQEWYFHNMTGFRTRRELTRDQIRIKYGNEATAQTIQF